MKNIKLNDIVSNSLPDNKGKVFSEKIDISDGFSLIKTNFRINKPYQISSCQNLKKMVVTISLNGKGVYKNHDGTNINFEKGYTTITSFDKTEGVTFVEASEFDQIRLILHEEFLKRNFSDRLLEKYGYFKQNSLNLVDFSPLHFESYLAIKQILKQREYSDLQLLYLQEKALGLLYTELNKSKQPIFLSSYEKEALMKARDLLLRDIKTSYSISLLAKKVHLSEVKLKKGFKDFFGITPYKFLKSQRLKQAKKLLLSGEYNINEVALMTGYKYANNFSSAFAKEFGLNPKEVLKSIKYY